jgi:hypothetical protein
MTIINYILPELCASALVIAYLLHAVAAEISRERTLRSTRLAIRTIALIRKDREGK